MPLVLLHVHIQQCRWQWHNMRNIPRQNPTPNPLKTDDFSSHRFAGILNFSTLMALPSNVLSIQLLFPYPQLYLAWSFTKHRRKGGERYKQDLTSGIDWIDSTKLSNNDSQIASFTATQRRQSRTLWDVYMLSSNRNFKSANMLLQDMLIHTNIICSKLPFVLYHQCSYTYRQIWVGHWHNSACRATLSAALFSKWSVQIQESFCFSSEVVWVLCCMYEAFASYLPRRLEITSRAGVRLTSCGAAQESPLHF